MESPRVLVCCISVKRVGRLKHDTPVPVFARDSLTVKVLQQRDGIFSGKPSQLLEARDIEQLAAQFAHPRLQLRQSALVNIERIRSDSEECPFA